MPTSPAPRKRFFLRGLAAVALLTVVAGVWQRERLWVKYCAVRLERSADGDRRAWGEKLAAAGERAVPTLVGLLESDSAATCAASRDALSNIVGAWPSDDPRRAAFAGQLLDADPKLSPAGRAAALDLLPGLLGSASPDLVHRVRAMVETAAKSEGTDARLQAVAAAFHPAIDHLPAIAPLLDDPSPDVRRAAVLALGPVRDGARPAVGDDLLLRRLHDDDDEVRRLCEMSLRSRGRSPRDIRLGRRYAAPDPAERQKLLLDLSIEEELDVTVWLERLTQDADPAVRAGAARVAADRRADLGARLKTMSQSDPDGTVRRIAGYYHARLTQR